MKIMEQFLANNPNPVISVEKDGTIRYSNRAGEPLLHEWGVEVGEKLPSCIGDFIQRVISQNSPEKMEVKAGKRVYLVAFHSFPEKECVNIYGFDISDQKELEEQLQKSEAKYRNLFETVQEVFYIDLLIYDEQGNVVDWIFEDLNPAGLELLGLKDIDEAKGKRGSEVLGREVASFYIPMIEKVRRSSKASTFQYHSPYVDREFLASFVVCGDRLISSHIDVSERKQMEEALKKAHDILENIVKERTEELEKAYESLKESEKGLAEAQKMAHIGNWDWDLITGEVYWSDELYRIFGRDPQKLAPSYNEYLNYIHPDDRTYFEKTVKKPAIDKPNSIDHRIILDNGEERIVNIQAEVVFNERNVPIRVKGIVQDITERKKVEEALRESEEKYRNIVETANEGILIINDKAIITYANKKITDMFGYRLEEGICRPIWDFISEESNAVAQLSMERRQKGINGSYELKLMHKDGSPIWAHINAKSLFDKNGRFIGSLSMLTDITKRREAEEALTNLEVVRQKEIHHRIKNNLQVISSLMDLQAEKFSNKECINNSEVLEAFRESQDRIASIALIHEELHGGEGEEALNFSLYIEKLVENLLRTYSLGNTDVSLNIDLEESVFFDMDVAVPLGMIVNEIVSNSLKYAFPNRENGEVQIKLFSEKSEYKHDNEGKFSGESTEYTLIVSDNGVGIPEKIDFKNSDTLGLQLVNLLVDQLNGMIELNREKGTEFIVKFSTYSKFNLEE
ncbi:MAG: PAS domain S-box protein [Methanosarcina sp.]